MQYTNLESAGLAMSTAYAGSAFAPSGHEREEYEPRHNQAREQEQDQNQNHPGTDQKQNTGARSGSGPHGLELQAYDNAE